MIYFPVLRSCLLGQPDSLSRIERNAQTEFAVYKFELGLTRSRLGFNPKGILVWEETIDEKDKTSQYTLYQPNELSNKFSVALDPYLTNGKHFDLPSTISLILLEQLGIHILNPLTLAICMGLASQRTPIMSLTQSSINSQGGRDNWRYTYDYRPDGYPYRMLSYRNQELAGTTEFIYNQ